MRRSIEFLGVTLRWRVSSDKGLDCTKVLFGPPTLALQKDGSVSISGYRAKDLFRYYHSNTNLSWLAESLKRLGAISNKTFENYKNDQEKIEARKITKRRRRAVTELSRAAKIRFTREQRNKLEACSRMDWL